MRLTESEVEFQSNWGWIRLGLQDGLNGIALLSEPDCPSFSMRIKMIVNEKRFECH